MSLRRHLRELQWRLMIVASFFIIGACLAYAYQESLIPLILTPLNGQELIYLNPAGGFSFIFLISIYAGIALSFPVFVQQVYAFLRPALPKSAHKKSSILIMSSFALLILGVLFGYFVAVPNALTFLFEFADQYVNASLTAESYLNFMIAYTIGIGIVFQIPLLLLLLNAIHPLTPGGLLQSEKWVVLIAFIVAAIITPTPDPVNQAIIAGPVIVVYQIGVTVVLISIARKKRRLKKELRATAATKPVQSSEPIQHTPIATAVQAAALPVSRPAPRVRPVDGFTIQRRPAPLRVPERPVPERSRPRPITPPGRQIGTTNGAYMDIIVPSQQITA